MVFIGIEKNLLGIHLVLLSFNKLCHNLHLL